MAPKLILVLFALFVLLSVAFAMPAVEPAAEVQPKETLQPAETIYHHLSFGAGGYSGYYNRGFRGAFGLGGLGYDYSPHYNSPYRYADDYLYYPYHY